MEEHKQDQTDQVLIDTARTAVVISLLFIICSAILIGSFLYKGHPDPQIVPLEKETVQSKRAPVPVEKNEIPAGAWKAPDENTIPAGKYGHMIRYGKELIAHTSKYFGPNGSVAHLANGMNCQNCHLAAGTKFFGNNYSAFIAGYPKKSKRSGQIESAPSRIAECFERSLAGKAPDPSGKEVQAMLAYMTWLGKDVKKGEKVFGSGNEKLKYLDRAADPKHGAILYHDKCRSCHGENGEGVMADDRLTYQYPPLWGRHSYNDGAGMYRLSNFAGFVKNNMPFGATYQNGQLTDEEAWDLAAFVNSRPRPHKEQRKDYPDLTEKPFDAPYGPYADRFTAQQHKFGPFQPIIATAKPVKTKS